MSGVPLPPSPAVPQFLAYPPSSKPKKEVQEHNWPLFKNGGDLLQAGRERLHEGRHPSPGPTRVTAEITQALDEVGDHLRTAQRASDDAQQDEARARQPGQRVAGSVPGFEKAIDKTALAEEAAVRAEAAANRALLCLQAAEQFNQQSAAAREAQKKVEAEHAAIEDKIQLAEVKRETFQRSRGIAEHKAREYEGAKAVARAQEMLVREATEKLQGRIEMVKAKRADVARVRAAGEAMKATLAALTGDEALRKLEARAAEVREGIRAKQAKIEEQERIYLEAQRAVDEAAAKAEAAREDAEERKARIADLQRRFEQAEAAARDIDAQNELMERTRLEKEHQAEQFARRHEEVTAEAEARERQLEDDVQAMLVKRDEAAHVTEEVHEKREEAEAVQDRIREKATEARRAATEARAAQGNAELAKQEVEKEAGVAEKAEEEARKIAEEAAAARDYAEKANAKKEAAWDEAKRLGEMADRSVKNKMTQAQERVAETAS